MSKDLVYTELGRNIRDARKASDFKQTQLAEIIGVSRTSLTNVECGRQGLSVFQLLSLADALGIEASKLLPSLSQMDKQQQVVPAGVEAWISEISKTKAAV